MDMPNSNKEQHDDEVAVEQRRTPHIDIKPEINLGNIITLLTVGAGIIYGYSTLNGKVDTLVAVVNKLETADARQQLQLDSVRDLANVRQMDLSVKVGRIETILERVERRLESPLPSSGQK
jgi:hypothetical protein